MMGDIYKSTERVISWLGEEEEEEPCGSALEVMAALGESILSAEEVRAVETWLFSNLVSLLRIEYSADNTYQQVIIDFSAAFIKSNKSLMWILSRL